jgi:hypothetical protein
MTPAQVGKASELQTVNDAVAQSEVDAASAPAGNAALAADPQAGREGKGGACCLLQPTAAMVASEAGWETYSAM